MEFTWEIKFRITKRIEEIVGPFDLLKGNGGSNIYSSVLFFFRVKVEKVERGKVWTWMGEMWVGFWFLVYVKSTVIDFWRSRFRDKWTLFLSFRPFLLQLKSYPFYFLSTLWNDSWYHDSPQSLNSKPMSWLFFIKHNI